MTLQKKNVIAAGIFLLTAFSGRLSAQVCHNLYPSPENATYDNGGEDLRGFVIKNKKDFLFKGSKVNEYSKNTWAYMQVRSSRVPSVDKNKENNHKLNYSEYIDVTSVMYKTRDDGQATWWARQCNSPKGPLVEMTIDPQGRVDMSCTRYSNIVSDVLTKKFTIVEYTGEKYNHKDYDDLLKNYIMIENGTIPDISDYATIIDYFNNFASKFSDIEDPLLEYKSFVTFFTAGKNRYAGYFNVVNNKLAGKLETVNLRYDRDKDVFVNQAFKKVTGEVVYVYGDEAFGMDKTINTYAREHNVKVIRRKTTTGKDFNKDISVHEPNRGAAK